MDKLLEELAHILPYGVTFVQRTHADRERREVRVNNRGQIVTLTQEYVEDVAERIVESLPDPTKWQTLENVPMNVDVLCKHEPSGRVFVGMTFGTRGFMTCDGNTLYATHWMPIPK